MPQGEGQILTTLAQLEAVADDWDSLHVRAGGGNPFLAHGWLTAYWRAFGDRSRLRVICVRAGRRLVAAAPLRMCRRRGVAVLTPLAAELSDFTDVLVDPGVPGAADELTRALLAVPGWAVLDAPEVPGGGGTWGLAAAWPGQTVLLPSSTCLELPIRPAPEMLAALPSRHRRDLGRQERRAERLGLRVERVPPGAERDGVAQLLDLHVRQWAGRPMNPLHVDPRFRGHLTDAVGRMAPAGQAALTRYHLADEVVGMSLALIANGIVGGYLYGVRPELREQLDVSALIVRADLELARSRGAARLSMLRGEEGPKLRWQPTARRSQRVLLLPPAVTAGHGMAVAALLRRSGDERLRQADRRSRLAAAPVTRATEAVGEAAPFPVR
jgi:CelD/BcsL family acetyltransferase involved in cellulose biosynthesis